MKILKNDWNEKLVAEFSQPYYKQLIRFLEDEYKEKTVYPAQADIFNALHYTSYSKTRVVILGQDPYHGPGQAHGLSFSVQADVKVPPSLRNIFKELQGDIQCKTNNGYLVPWAKQGVLLLNTVLTVRASEPGSHKGIGWERFTDKVIQLLNERSEPVIFLLWGRQAEEKRTLITQHHHYVLVAPHPSPFSAHRGFFGSRPFSKINKILGHLGSAPIDWELKL